MIPVIILACLVSVVSAECLRASTPHLKLKSGDIAIGSDSFDKPVNFNQAQDQCKSIGGQLINVENDDKSHAVLKCFEDNNLVVDFVWTGAEYVNNKWQWSNGQAVSASEYCEDGEPSASGPCSFNAECGITIDNTGHNNGCLNADDNFKDLEMKFACEVKSS